MEAYPVTKTVRFCAAPMVETGIELIEIERI